MSTRDCVCVRPYRGLYCFGRRRRAPLPSFLAGSHFQAGLYRSSFSCCRCYISQSGRLPCATCNLRRQIWCGRRTRQCRKACPSLEACSCCRQAVSVLSAADLKYAISASALPSAAAASARGRISIHSPCHSSTSASLIILTRSACAAAQQRLSGGNHSVRTLVIANTGVASNLTGCPTTQASAAARSPLPAPWVHWLAAL